MVQRKQQKSKPKKKPHVKKQGKSADMGEFRSQLDALGLKIIQVTSDGNCFFRAMADQLEGNEEEHLKYRNMVVQYILKHREDFEPFIEDGVPFDEYCKSMQKDGTWAGNMELQAASLVTQSNVCIHRIREPRWYIRNFHNQTRIIHLSYHNEEHYNSVRAKEDPCDGPARSIVIKVDSALTPTSKDAKGVPKLKEVITCKDSVNMVVAGSGCENVIKVEQILQLVDDDVDAAVEFLIAERRADDNAAGNDEYLGKEMYGQWENGEYEWEEEATTNHTCEHDSPTRNNIKSICDDKNIRRIDKNIPRNKWCPCGSKKKYKECCGSVNGSSSSDYVNSHRVAPRKVKVQRKQNKKGGPTKVAPSDRSEENIPDMGALCI